MLPISYRSLNIMDKYVVDNVPIFHILKIIKQILGDQR